MKTKQIQLFDFSRNKVLLKDDILNLPIEELNLSVRAYNVLKRYELKKVKNIITFGIDNLRKAHQAGEKTIKSISDAIKSAINLTDISPSYINSRNIVKNIETPKNKTTGLFVGKLIT